MSQFLVDLKSSEGLTVRPIRNIAGDEGFNEVVMDACSCPTSAWSASRARAGDR